MGCTENMIHVIVLPVFLHFHQCLFGVCSLAYFEVINFATGP